MKRCAAFALVTVLCVLLMGAAPPAAPVVSTKGFYVNDYASMLFGSHRDDILALSTGLYDQTGIQIVVLTVESLGDLDADAYADAIIRGWEIGGQNGENGALILVADKEKIATVKLGGSLQYLSGSIDSNFYVDSGGLSKSIMNVYRPMVSAVYAHEGVDPGADTLKKLENPAGTSAPFTGGAVIFLVVALLLMGRSLRVSQKYRRKYLRGNVRQVKTYARSYNEEDRYKDQKEEDMYEIKHDNMD